MQNDIELWCINFNDLMYKFFNYIVCQFAQDLDTLQMIFFITLLFLIASTTQLHECILVFNPSLKIKKINIKNEI